MIPHLWAFSLRISSHSYWIWPQFACYRWFDHDGVFIFLVDTVSFLIFDFFFDTVCFLLILLFLLVYLLLLYSGCGNFYFLMLGIFGLERWWTHFPFFFTWKKRERKTFDLIIWQHIWTTLIDWWWNIFFRFIYLDFGDLVFLAIIYQRDWIKLGNFSWDGREIGLGISLAY